MEEHANYGVDFILATKGIEEQCPYITVSGGICNSFFGFREVNIVRDSIHSMKVDIIGLSEFWYRCALKILNERKSCD